MKQNVKTLVHDNEKREQTGEQRGKAFKKFAFVLAWIYFLAVVGLAVFEALKDHKPPERDDFLK